MAAIEMKTMKSRCGDVGTTISSVRDPSWWFAHDSKDFAFPFFLLVISPYKFSLFCNHNFHVNQYLSTGFGNELEFPLPCPTRCCHTVYHPVIRVDYTPPIAGMFVPSYLKAFVKEMTTLSSDDKNKNSFLVVVGNLPPETRNHDLLQLFQPFGHVIGADVAIAHHTGLSGRFAFVNFATKEAAQSAIERLNGIDYHNFILRVECSTPTTT